MLIDWFTVIAQIVNFLLLVWLLKRFLYKPILEAIDEREKRIKTQIGDAETQMTQAKGLQKELQHKNAAFDQERAALLSKATTEANTEGQRLLEEARKESNARRSQLMAVLQNEQDLLGRKIIQRAQSEVFGMARKALQDLASQTLEAQITGVFIHRLLTLADKEKESLAEALDTSVRPAILRSTFDLPAEQKLALKKTLHEIRGADIEIRFETAPELLSGIELTTNGYQLTWSISDYLSSMEKNLATLLKDKADPTPDPKPIPLEALPVETSIQ